MDTKHIVEQYESGIGMNTLAKKNGTNVYQIKKILRDSNIRIRSKHEANDLANRRKAKKVDDNYFKKWSNNMAYILGLLGADGYIRSDRNLVKLTLKSEDKELLEQIKSEMSVEREIGVYTAKIDDKECEYCELCFSSKEIKQDLEKLGIYNNKTFTVDMSDLIPDRYKIDFFRGYFDGDGCIDGNKSQQMRVRVVSGSKSILSNFVKFLYQLYKIPMVKVHYDESRSYYHIAYSTLSAIKIYEAMYKENSLHLTRKKQEFEKIIARR